MPFHSPLPQRFGDRPLGATRLGHPGGIRRGPLPIGLLPIVLLAAGWLAGCQAAPYRYGRFHPEGAPAPALVVVRGEPHRQLDAARAVVRSPLKLIPERWRPAERTTTEAETELYEYLEHNELTDLHVEIGHYDPAEQFRRLHANDRIGAGWRYTVGVASLLPYTLFPSRVFGTTQYNPFTNTLSLNSPSVPKTLYEAAWAKQVRSQSVPGTYVVGSVLPGVGLLCKAQTGDEVLGYLRSQENWELEKQAYPHVYGELGAEGLGLVGYLTPLLPGPTASFAGRAVGGLAGKLIADTRPSRTAREIEPESELELGPMASDAPLVAGSPAQEPLAAADGDDAGEPGVVLVRGLKEPADTSAVQPVGTRKGLVEQAGGERATARRKPGERGDEAVPRTSPQARRVPDQGTRGN
ncbi:MAG: hypothetical protein ACKOGA_23705 [Planctomycetaceae bacterium]